MQSIRKIIIVGNWKMNLNVAESSLLLHRLHERIKVNRQVDVVLAPSFLALQPLSLQLDRRKFRLAAQNAFHKDQGAFTGEVSFEMMRGLIHYCIVGHSERRIYFNETLETVRDKVSAAVRNEIIPILCIGENRHEREAGETKRVLHDQLTTAVSDLTSEEIEDVVLVYEPPWAISTFEGVVAKPSDVESAIKFMRMQIRELYGDKAAERVRILYGGSVNDQDIRAYLEVEGCDGAIVGGASLHYYKFASIVATADRVQHQKAKQS